MRVHETVSEAQPVGHTRGPSHPAETLAEEVDRLRREIRERDHHRQQFIAMLSHELRNPLAPILSALHVMRVRGGATPEGERARTIVERQARHLVHILDGLLDLSRITRGKIALRCERTSLDAVLAAALESTRPLFEGRRHSVALQRDASLWLDADPVRLEQIFCNVLDNAARFTEPGGAIQVSVRREGSHAVVLVSDSGTGISPNLLPHIFDLFTQAERGLDRRPGGLGIGLTLVRTLVEMHGGSVAARSAGPGCGSEFEIRLQALAEAPHDPVAVYSSQPQPIPVSSGLRILLVDDNEDAIQTLAEIVGMWGHDVRTAFDGPSALHAAYDRPPDVVLLDIGLPTMNGYEVAHALRADPRHAHAVLVALTGYGQESDRQRALAAGFDHHLVKPVSLVDLEALLARCGRDAACRSAH